MRLNIRANTLALVLLAVLAAPATARGGGAAVPLMPFAQALRFSGASVPFTVEIDLSRTRTQPGGPLRILVTAITAGGEAVNIESRPVGVGEKLTWRGRLPAQGNLIIHVLDAGRTATSTDLRRNGEPIRLVITGDEKGSFGVSDGRCPPRTNGICGVSSR